MFFLFFKLFGIDRRQVRQVVVFTSGNLTLEIYARPVNSSLADFRFIKQEFPQWVLIHFLFQNESTSDDINYYPAILDL